MALWWRLGLESWPSPNPWLCWASASVSLLLQWGHLRRRARGSDPETLNPQPLSLFSFLSPRMPVGVTRAPLRKNRPLTPAMNPTGLSLALYGHGPATQSLREVGRAGAHGGAGEDTSYPQWSRLPRLCCPRSRWPPSTGFPSQESGRGCILSPAQHLQGSRPCSCHDPFIGCDYPVTNPGHGGNSYRVIQAISESHGAGGTRGGI